MKEVGTLKRRRKNKRVEASLYMLFVMVGFLIVITVSYYQLERRRCFSRLIDYVEQAADTMYREINADRRYLEKIASILAQENLSDYENMKTWISFMGGTEMTSQFELLLPGNLLLGSDGIQDVSDIMSFDREAALGSHIFQTKTASEQGESLCIRECVPVIKDGKTMALLCGVVDLKQLSHKFTIQEYGSAMQFYVVERSTGQFLLDTWHDTLGSMETLKNRKAGAGYSRAQFLGEFEQGKSGITVFRSEKAGEDFYASYTPVGVEDWMVLISVPESSVFAHARNILVLFISLTLGISLIFAVYLFWTLRDAELDKKENEKNLKHVQYILDVEKNLFSAHTQPEYFQDALKKIAEFFSAESAFFWGIGDNFFGDHRVWDSRQGSIIGKNLQFGKKFPNIFQKIQKEGSFISYHLDTDLRESPNELKFLSDRQVDNLMMIPVKNIGEEIIAVLGVVNLKKYWESAEPLEQVALSFSITAEQYNSYQQLGKMSSMDTLTGLLNRNSYHMALDAAAKQKWNSFACVYTDANGLHEINNHLGHQAGDEMLVKTANALKESFLSDSIYRIGGDEFVVLCWNQGREEVDQKAELLRQRVQEQGYELSIGVEWQEGDVNITRIVEAAETSMRADKQQYYEKNGRERQIRILNEKTAKILSQKQDMDMFLTVIAPQFKGVYFVKLNTDSSRHIFIPPYFEEILSREGGWFSKGMQSYAQQLVKPEYYERVSSFCSYTYLEEQFEKKQLAEVIYQKIDDTWMRLQVLRLKQYSREQKETLWIFVELEGPPKDERNLIRGGGNI